MRPQPKPDLTSVIDKLVCRHGDFFCVVPGHYLPQSREGIRCTEEMFPREPHSGRTECRECRVLPGGYHRLHCSKERCPHCSRRLLTCLARKHGLTGMAQLWREAGPTDPSGQEK